MQINFTPHKIKAAKAYIENLIDDEKLEKKNKKVKISIFRKIINLFKKSSY